MKDKLIEICKKPIYQVDLKKYCLSSFDKYPYIPYIPEQWNNILVLAESQQLRGKKKGNKEYLKKLTEVSVENQITRLGNNKIFNGDKIGIWPWDNGYIKLALLTVFPNERVRQYALSNSVPWHLDKTNKKQCQFLKKISVTFWSEILQVIKPKVIICTGNIAKEIISKTHFCDNNKCKQYNIRSASQLHFVAKKDFEIKKYPDLIKIYNENIPYISQKQPMRYYIYYMAHAKNIINK